METLNLEMHINKYNYSYGRNKRRRKRKKEGILRIILLLSAIILFSFVIFHFLFKNNISDKYNTQKYISDLDSFNTSRLYAKAFASDISIYDGTDFDFDYLDAYSGLLSPNSGSNLIYNKNAFSKMNPASTTKIMTALLAIKYADLDALVEVGNEIIINEAGSSMAGLNIGDKIKLRDLIYGLMLPSGNDAANAIAVHVSGSIDAFVDLMNNEAKAIGATDTNFSNPSGLTDKMHYTSAYDLYLIFHEALKYPIFREVTATKDYIANYIDKDGNNISKAWANSNKYLSDSVKEPEGVIVFSGKTGTTKAAGSCLVIAALDNSDKEFISIILKADNRDELYENMTKLLIKIPQ